MPDAAEAMDKLHEEVAELQKGIEAGDQENIIEELGDVLLQVVFHASLAEETACAKAQR